MNLHQQTDDARRLRRAIERWENEGGQISVKGKEAPPPIQGEAKRKATAGRERSSTSSQTKFRRTGSA